MIRAAGGRFWQRSPQHPESVPDGNERCVLGQREKQPKPNPPNQTSGRLGYCLGRGAQSVHALGMSSVLHCPTAWAPSLSQQFQVSPFGELRGLPKALSSSSAPQLCRSFSFLPEAELSAQRCVPSTAGHGSGRGCIQNPCGDIPRETHCSNPRAGPNGQTFVFLQDLIPSGNCFLLVF